MNLIGIDLGIHKISLACFTGDQLVWADTHGVPPEQCRSLQLRELAAFAHDITHMHGAESVWVEDTIIGNNRKYSIQLAQVMGAVLASLGAQHLHQGTDVRVVDNRVWKKAVVGAGHASKDQIKDYIHVTYPAYAPLCGEDQDLYDATCVGLYGLSIIERAKSLQLG